MQWRGEFWGTKISAVTKWTLEEHIVSDAVSFKKHSLLLWVYEQQL